MLFDKETGHFFELFEGSAASFLRDSGQLIFNDGFRLIAVATAIDTWPESTIRADIRGKRIDVVPLKGSEVLVAVRSADGGMISRHDIYTEEEQALEELSTICDLDGAIWIDGAERLFCPALLPVGEEAEFLFATLEGRISQRVSMPEGKTFRALVYVANQSVIVLGATWRGWMGDAKGNDVWIYDMDSDEIYLLAQDQDLGSSVALGES